MATQTNNLLLVEAGVTRTLDATNDDIQIGAATTFTKILTTSAGLAVTGDATVSGNLEVTGDIVSRGSSNILIQDPIIDLATNNSATAAKPGGFTVQMNRNSGFTVGTVTTFVAGVGPAVSAPTFTYTDAGSSTLLAAGDVVVIYGSDNASNDGLYVVQSVSAASFPQTVTIKGTGGTAVSGYTPFAQNQFTADTGNTAQAYKIDLAVGIFADGSVNFKDGGGSNYAKGTFITAYKANATDSDFSGNGAYSVPTGSLQDAYVSGNTITTSGGEGNLVVAGTEKLEVTATNGLEVTNLLDLNGSLDADVTLFEVDSSGAISLDSTSTASNFTLTANDAGTATLTIAATNSGAGVADIDVDADGALNLTGGAASKINTTAGDLTLDAEAASLVLDGGEAAADAVRIVASNAAGGIDVDAGTGGITVDTTGALSIDSADTTNLTMTANAVGSKTLTVEANNAGAGGAVLALKAETSVQLGDSTSYSTALIETQNFVNIKRSAGLSIVAGETLAVGDALVAEYDSGSASVRYFKAANNAATDAERNVHGIALSSAASAGNAATMGSISGVSVSTALTGLVTGDVGKTVYLGTGGALTLTAPTASGTTVFKVGYIISHNGGPSSTAVVLFQPQFIAKNP
jgi:hypothetical protein